LHADALEAKLLNFHPRQNFSDPLWDGND